VTCLNNSPCRSLLLDYKCECLSAEYSGRHCENLPTSILLRQYVSKTFGYVGIIALSVVVSFVVIMDILKYGFGIDPVQEERDLTRRRRALLRQKDRETRDPQSTLRLRRENKVSPQPNISLIEEIMNTEE
jgi:hypothetical protein